MWIKDAKRNGVVTGQSQTPRSYHVRTDGNTLIRRNRGSLVDQSREEPSLPPTSDLCENRGRERTTPREAPRVDVDNPPVTVQRSERRSRPPIPLDSIALQEDMDSLQRWESDWLMQFHPQKCQTMHITNKRNIIQSTYSIHNHKLQTTNTAKYLGIHIHSTLNWNTHINKTAQRANRTSAFLHRNIRTCPHKTKHLAYTTLVRPILECASIIWDPHTASNIHKLETVQRRSARHIMHNYSRHASVTTMLQYIDLPTLQQRRQH